jgi:predicted DNA-binding transcriptional regulator AlpA
MPKSRAAPKPPDLSPLLNGTQVCEALGISSRTLDRLTADDELPPDHLIRGRNRWRPESVVAYREAHRASKEVV